MLIDFIDSHYPKSNKKGGRPPYPLATQPFASVKRLLRILDETTILTFHHLLEKHDLGQQIFATVKTLLGALSMTMRQGMIVDATLIAAPSSNKNNDEKRDPEMHQTKKGNQCYFGMKVHLGVDKDSGLIHSVVNTSANLHDLTPAAELLHGDEEVVYADAGYPGISKRFVLHGLIG